jgi:aspartyl-tRNA(Asn)/glutamyl-tRNA(Gln) amidotransferase subunit A
MAAALRAGQVSSVELVERALERARAWQPITNAFSQVWVEPAMAAAGEADRIRARGGEDPPPLLGVPIAVKDLFDVQGFETTGCCRVYAGTVAERDAPAIARVRAAGAVIVGKTNQHELALGGSNLFSACGRTGNPRDPERMTGGSSGGSAAAVATAVVPGALGSDTGGSIRIPASMCGTFGLKVTTGRIPIDGMLPLAPSLDTPGPIAATGADLRALYLVLAGIRWSPGRIPDDGGRIRLGLLGGYYAQDIHPDARAAVEAVATAFEGTGATVEPVDGTGIEDARRVWRHVTYPEFVEAHPALRGHWDQVQDPSIVAAADQASRSTAPQRAEAAERRAEIARWFRERLTGFDALLVPTTGYAAPPAGARMLPAWPGGEIDLERIGPGWFTCPVNLAGLPAVSIPAGWSSEGLPIGVSLIGHHGAEEPLLDLATLWEAATAYRPPTVARPPTPADPAPAS